MLAYLNCATRDQAQLSRRGNTAQNVGFSSSSGGIRKDTILNYTIGPLRNRERLYGKN